MEELMGTQKPVRRILAPEEAIAALERVVPGLAELRRQDKGVFDWRTAEEKLGTGLPSDFKALAEWYPAFELDDFLGVFTPWPGEEGEWAEARDEEARDSSYDADLRPPELVTTHLISWGESKEGDRFFWSVLGDDPEDWRVTVCSRNGPWWHYAGGVVQFLTELCDGVLEPWALPPVRPEVTGWGDGEGGWQVTV
ncbi:hypothetical protein [Streptomyces sp. MAR4 CNX-425]|uniref:hypothetical protein n=1 Tax=Streptomyces sp. MAR4 CNX-425 TaxID=3406343 RepID=UPI003B508B54